MFTGIVQAVGRVAEQGAGKLVIDAPPQFPRQSIEAGESIAVNGCCLTVKAQAAEATSRLSFDLSAETLARTNLGALRPGASVNLERAMLATARIGGHFVQGHVDCTGRVTVVERLEGGLRMGVNVPEAYADLLIDKGSVALDGVSLTVVDPQCQDFSAWIVPHTLAATNLGSRLVGDAVNLEFDMLAKYVQSAVKAALAGRELR